MSRDQPLAARIVIRLGVIVIWVALVAALLLAVLAVGSQAGHGG